MSRTKPILATADEGVRNQILDAAGHEFAAKGLRGASVRSIAGRAGVTAAMINYYFGGKQALYDVVVERAQARLFAIVTRVLDEPDRSGLAARLAAAYFDFLCEERDLPRLLLREVLDEGDSLQVLLHQYVAPLRDLLAHQIGGGDDVFHTVVSVFGAIAGYFIYAPVLGPLLGDDPLAAERLAQRRRHVVALAGLVTQGIHS